MYLHHTWRDIYDTQSRVRRSYGVFPSARILPEGGVLRLTRRFCAVVTGIVEYINLHDFMSG